MQRKPAFPLLATLLVCCGAQAGEEPSFDYFQTNRAMIRNGVQAVLMCNGLFTSQRSLQDIDSQPQLGLPGLPGGAARFGLLYLQNGIWQGERLIAEEWIHFVRTPAPATAGSGRFYGGQWWLVPDDRDDVPRDAYTTAGNRGQYVIVVPSHALVIVRRGLDFGSQGFDPWDLTREVLQAFRY